MRTALNSASVLSLLSAASLLATPGPPRPLWAPAATDPLMLPGIAAATCAAQKFDAAGNPLPANCSFSLVFFDLRNPNASDYQPPGFAMPLWNPALYHHADWSVENIGSVFGTAIDRDGNVYVAAHGLYTPFWGAGFGSPYLQNGLLGLAGGATEAQASGTIYKIDRITGVATVYVRLPQQPDPDLPWNPLAGPGIGQLAYDEDHDQFFATNLEDGTIYQIDNLGATGLVVDTFDPFDPTAGLALDDGTPGMPTFGDNLWGIGVANNAVYYAVWKTGDAVNPNLIRKIDLTSSGAMIKPSDQTVLVVPPSPGATGGATTPVTDISFSADGARMLLGERGMHKQSAVPSAVFNDYYVCENHKAPVRIAQLIASVWNVTNTLATGNNASFGEGYGGVAYGYENGNPEELVWMSSADIATGAGPHGLQAVRPSDFPVAIAQAPLSYAVPYDPGYTANGPDVKSVGGDVEIMQEDAACARITVTDIACPPKPGEPFKVTLDIKNLVDVTAVYGWLTPCPEGDLPEGAITLVPDPRSLFELASPVGQGESTTECFYLPGLSGGETVCLRLTLFSEDGSECCTEKFCFEIPKCDCASVRETKVACKTLPNGDIKYTITLTVQNLTNLTSNPYGFSYVTFTPIAGFSPPDAVPSPNPIPPGGVGTVVACWICTPAMQPCPDKLCFDLALHDETLVECCAIPVCVKLPPCAPLKKPDECSLAPERAPCCPDPDGLGAFADVTLTICNNFCEERTYDWQALGDPTLPGALSFTPSSGTLGPIPPGECRSVVIRIRCDGLEPGHSATYKIDIVDFSGATKLCCEGSVYNPPPGSVVIKEGDPAGLIGPLALGETVSFGYVLTNHGPGAVDVPVLLISDYGALALGLEGGELSDSALQTVVSLLTGESVPLNVVARRRDDGSTLPTFVRVRAYVGPGVALVEQTPPDLIRVVQVPGIVPPAPVLQPVMRSIFVELMPGPAGGILKISIDVLQGPLEVSLMESPDLVNWSPSVFSLTPGGPTTTQSPPLNSGRHELYVAQPDRGKSFYQVYCE